MKECKVICFANQKGGVGKTTVCAGVASAAAAAGEKVLMIDFDPQRSLTYLCSMTDDEHETLLSAVDKDQLPIYNFANGIDVTPGERDFYLDSKEAKKLNTETVKRLIDKERSNYTLILADLPPAVSILHGEVVNASDYVIVPSMLSTFAIDGVNAMYEYLSTIGQLDKFLGIIFTQYKPNLNLSKMMMKTYDEYYHKYLFKSAIPVCIAIDEAQVMGQPILEYAPKSKAAVAFIELYNEIINRLS